MRVSDEELLRWVEVAERVGGRIAYIEGKDGIPLFNGQPWFGAAVFDLQESRRREKELEAEVERQRQEWENLRESASQPSLTRDRAEAAGRAEVLAGQVAVLHSVMPPDDGCLECQAGKPCEDTRAIQQALADTESAAREYRERIRRETLEKASAELERERDEAQGRWSKVRAFRDEIAPMLCGGTDFWDSHTPREIHDEALRLRDATIEAITSTIKDIRDRERVEFRALAGRAVEALDNMQMEKDCWCEVAIGNPNFRGRHADRCATNTALLAALRSFIAGSPQPDAPRETT